MAYQFISVDTQQGARTIKFNRPEVLNSFHTPMSREVQAALADIAADRSIRAVVLTGAGRAFCAGQDLAEVRTPADGQGPDLAEHVRTVFNPIVRALRELDRPVIAAVNGVAAGAGANLALAADFVIASRTASFIQAFIRIGLVPDTGGTFFLPRLVGLARATALTMLGEKLTADQALELGMIYRVSDPDRLAEETAQFAIRLAAEPTQALGMTKQLLNASLTSDLETQLEHEARLQGAAGRSADYAEGVAAFLDKRAPNFQGR